MKPPATLDDCVHLVVSSLGEDQAEQIRSLDEKDLSMLHFGLGLWIRNKIIHPRTPFMKSLEASAVFIHPDTVSTLIVEAVWAYLEPASSTPGSLFRGTLVIKPWMKWFGLSPPPD